MSAWEFCQDLQHRGTQAEMDFLGKIEGHPIEDWYEFVGTYEYRKLEDNYIPDEVIERKYQTQFGHQLSANQDTTE